MELDAVLQLLAQRGLLGRTSRVVAEGVELTLYPETPQLTLPVQEKRDPEHAREVLQAEFYHSSEGGPY